MLSPGDQRAGRGLGKRQMRSAHEVADAEAAQSKQPLDPPDVPGLASVRRAHQGDVCRAQPEAFHAAGLQQRKDLERLRCRTKENLPGRVAGAGQQPPRLVHDGGVPAVPGLDEIPPEDSRENRRGHSGPLYQTGPPGLPRLPTTPRGRAFAEGGGRNTASPGAIPPPPPRSGVRAEKEIPVRLSGQEVLPVAFNSLNPEHADCSSVTLDHEGNCDRVRRQGIDEKSTVLRPRSN